MNPKNQGCIYLLRNTANGMCYVGQSIHNPPTQRIASHLGEGYYYDEYGVKQKSLYSHGNRLIKTDVEKYGKSVFEWAILRDNIADEDLDDCEAEEIARHNTYRPNGYNLYRGANKYVIDKHNSEVLPRFIARPDDRLWEYDKERKGWLFFDDDRDSWFFIMQLPKEKDNE